VTSQPSGGTLPLAAAFAVQSDSTDEDNSTEPLVGAADAEADAARAGGDADLSEATRDSDGVPVGEDDLEADKRGSNA